MITPRLRTRAHHACGAVMALSCLWTPASAQRDAPVWDSYLDRIAVYQQDRQTTSIEFVWQKGGGAHEHKQHQVYLLAYLEKNERTILELMRDHELMTIDDEPAEGAKQKKSILEVLLDRGLVTVLETTVAMRIEHERNKEDPKTAGRVFAFPFAFRFENAELLDRIRQLPGFDTKPPTRMERDDWYSEQFPAGFKIMPFIPANDSRYANLVRPENKTSYDFSYGESYSGDWIAQYARPLPYVFDLVRISTGRVLIHIH